MFALDGPSRGQNDDLSGHRSPQCGDLLTQCFIERSKPVDVDQCGVPLRPQGLQLRPEGREFSGFARQAAPV